jgi:hypothetical protein
MRYIIILLSIVIVFWVGKFAYTFWIRPIDKPTSEIRAIETYFNNNKVIGHIYPVRHGFSHSRVIAVAAFEIKDFPLPFGLTACATEHEAIIISAQRDELPDELQSIRNGKIVLDFISWGDDAVKDAQEIRELFLAYRIEP